MSNEPNAANPGNTAAATTPNMEELVIAMARAVAAKPDEVAVESFEEDGVMVIELSVAQEDLGKVIGRQGRTVRSMRVVLEAASENLDLPYELDIVEDDDEDEGEEDGEEGGEDAQTGDDLEGEALDESLDGGPSEE
jgi:predicted RNA-binding protein YlqC (UPF0109 family)